MLGRRNNEGAKEGDGEGWSTVNRRRSSHNEEGAEQWGAGDKLRDRNRRADTEHAIEEQPRRNGLARGGKMGGWRDEQAEAEGTGTRAGVRTWRGERERDRDRDRVDRGDRDSRDNREWTRGHKVQDKLDEEPEWMSEPIVKPQEKEAKTQDDFERWKAEQRAKSSGNVEKEEMPSFFTNSKETKPVEPAKPVLNFSGFGTFGAKKAEPKPQQEAPAAQKIAPLAGLGKTSKFVGLFKKEETPPSTYDAQPEPQPQAEAPAPLPGLPAFFSQPPPQAASPPNGAGSSKEDAEGFARILQMLGGVKVGSPQSQQPSQEGVSLKSALFPNGMAAEAQRTASGGTRPDSASLVNELLARHTANRSRGPQSAPAEPEPTSQYFSGPGGEYGRMNGGREENAIPRQGLFSPTNGTRQRPETPQDQKRDFLLKLIENNSRGAKLQPQANAEFLKQAQLAGVPQKGPVAQHMQQQMYPPEMQQRPLPSAPPGLGMFDRGGMPEHDMQHMRKHTGPQQGRPSGLPSFFDDGSNQDQSMMGMPNLQRRTTNEQQNGIRPPVSNMGIPTQSAPSLDQHHQFRDLPNHAQQELQRMQPPPGFQNLPRVPPGFQPPPQHLQSPQNGMPPHQQYMPGGRPQGPPGMFGPPPMHAPQQQGYFGGPPPPGFPPNDFFMNQQGRGRGGPPFM